MRLKRLGEFVAMVVSRSGILALPVLLAGTSTAGGTTALPNLALPSLGGVQFWTDRHFHAGWRIQENAVTGHARLLDPDNVRRGWGSYASCRSILERLRTEHKIEPGDDHLVILVHGLGRSRASFGRLQRALEAAGYEVAAVSYASTRRSVTQNADDLSELVENLEGVNKVSFVTHSLGGLIVRNLLARVGASWRKRIAVNALIMTAPPNQGSKMADILQYVPPVNLILWRGLLGARTDAVANLPAPDVPFAIIAADNGGRGWNPVLDGDDDLIVSVRETRLEGAAGWMRVDSIHSFVMNHPDSVGAVLNFLTHRRFPRSE